MHSHARCRAEPLPRRSRGDTACSPRVSQRCSLLSLAVLGRLAWFAHAQSPETSRPAPPEVSAPSSALPWTPRRVMTPELATYATRPDAPTDRVTCTCAERRNLFVSNGRDPLPGHPTGMFDGTRTWPARCPAWSPRGAHWKERRLQEARAETSPDFCGVCEPREPTQTASDSTSTAARPAANKRLSPRLLRGSGSARHLACECITKRRETAAAPTVVA